MALFHAIYEVHGCDLIQLEHVLMLMWRVWGARNEFYFNARVLSPKQIVESSSLQYMSMYQSHHSLSSRDRLNSPSHLRWLPPDKEHLELNVDASFTKYAVGYGVVLLNHK